MGDYIAIRYRVKLKQEVVQKVTDALTPEGEDAILSWNRASLKFDDTHAYWAWRNFLDNEISLRWPFSNTLHFNPQGWPDIKASLNSLSGVLKGTQCLKVIPGGIAVLVAILPLIADEWKVEIDIRDMLFSLDYTGNPVDIYSDRGNDLFENRRNIESDNLYSGFGG